ncbi:hypothetical protein K505DRAFT_252165 [Melanomma pulvis-pyrius CBS 109.77]|uniref:F-box domain-containing protein n=1 Tax=Melanomma pulvis-pyrius CBS 109.77 TaxID=1314802 RepID=A0A6A6X0Y9_9PLEO|nr:hypothetical protein K505DRAFT_252165 [Melanomma pulvis-pyrius CBS 109.77]
MFPPPLLRLPIELHRDIIDKLELQDRVRLAHTCRYFLSTIKPPTHGEFLATETSPWAVSNQLYTCRGCVRFRHLRRFTDDMRKGKRARRGVEAHTRFCVDCGVDRQWYTPGTEVTIMGQSHVLCMHCKNFPGLTQKECLEECLPCSRDIQKMSAGSCTSDEQYDSEDDWGYSTRSFVGGKHSDEFNGVYPDI